LWGWQSLYWIGSLSFLLLPFMHMTLPESPKFLAINGRVAEIREMLARLRPERAHIYATATIAADDSHASGNLILKLLQPRYRRTTLAIWAAAFLSLFCIFGLSGWIPTVMIARGETFAASFGFGALMQIMSFVGSLVLGHLVDRFGRNRGLLGLWWGLGGCAVLTLVFLNDHLVNITCVAAAGFFIIGAQFVLNNFTAAAYETNVRATAVGMELSVGRVGAILGPFVAGALQQHYQSALPMFISIGVAALAAGGIILLAGRARVACRRIADFILRLAPVTNLQISISLCTVQPVRPMNLRLFLSPQPCSLRRRSIPQVVPQLASFGLRLWMNL
jgi:AAHS family 4-hydroxybenzoate transporter-like MFS transporter